MICVSSKICFIPSYASFLFIILYPGPRGFLLPQRDETRKKKEQQEKNSGRGQRESHYHAAIYVTRID